jgi:hypothetical protein
VIWATGRNRPVGRAALAEAQVAYARYRQARAQRALDRQRRRWRWRVVALVFLCIAAAYWAAMAAAQGQQRTIDSLVAAGYVLGALGNVLENSRSLRRQGDRMARLQTRIKDRTHVG